MKQISFALLVVSALSFSNIALANQEDESEFSAEPLSEMDMGQVALDAGINVLSVYGTSQAGLTVDADGSGSGSHILELSSDDENDTTATAHSQEELKKILNKDEPSTSSDNSTQEKDEESLQAAVDETQLEVGNSEVFTTTSEIQYKKNKFKHKLVEQNKQSGSVTLSRDMHIELLKFENIGGDHYDRSRSVGNIYLSDWKSRGDTTITPR